MFKLYDLNNAKIFNSYKELFHYCICNGFTPKTINYLIAFKKYYGISLEYNKED